MTEKRPPSPSPLVRAEGEVVRDQLHGIAAWMRSHPVGGFSADGSLSREARLFQARHRDAVERQRQALIDWTARQLSASARVRRSAAATRVVIVHRNDWFTAKITSALEALGVSVVATVENGAEAIGVVVAEQPDVLVVEDKLPMTTGLDVARAAREFAPNTVVVAHVESDADIAPFLDAGARTAYPRRVPPADIAADLHAFFAT